ncbi:MAG: tRNA lysidine(34) synthetase TilS [Deltaproteobacteria bacterium]|nr:tRNA lysidine(34) synthetase TilS [Deltaproteobacteria bacterium]MBN2688540.1 tRNA lysidine(34) synthetase TilS [Deltaproteobacteria bacterium]
MLDLFRKTIARYNMLSHGDTVGVALSGGPDSTALLHGLLSVAEEYAIKPVIMHLNHGLRMPEADREEAFVHEQGRKLTIPVISRKVSVPELWDRERGSLEDICRRERYRFFREETVLHKIDKIALGHNKNDQAETVIMRFLRGSGLDGLKGMLPVRDGIYIRPLIETSREEIDRFLQSKGLSYVEDASNKETVFLRNRVRHTLLRELERDFNPRIIETLSRLSGILRMENDFMEHAVEACFRQWRIDPSSGGMAIGVPKFKTLHPALQYRVVKKLLRGGLQVPKEIGYAHVEAVVDLIHGTRPQARLDLPGGMAVYREYDCVTIRRGEIDVPRPNKSPVDKKKRGLRDDKRDGNDYDYKVTIPGVIDIKEIGRGMKFEYVERGRVDFHDDATAFIDMGAVAPPLTVRNFRTGDTITPLGMTGTKKVKSIFIDEKIPSRDRHSLPLLVDALSVVWIPGVRLHDRVKVTDTTEAIAKIEMI